MPRWTGSRYPCRDRASGPSREASPEGKDDSLDPIAAAELAEHAADVGLHGRLAEERQGSDLRVGQALRHVTEYLPLAVGQPSQARGVLLGDLALRGERLDQATGDRRC